MSRGRAGKRYLEASPPRKLARQQAWSSFSFHYEGSKAARGLARKQAWSPFSSFRWGYEAACGLLVAALFMTGLASCNSSRAIPEEATKGGTFKIGLVRVNSLDPVLASTVSDRVLADFLYDGLTAWDPKGLSAVPALAERWEASDDQKQWTFHLKVGIMAGNGEPITASDVKTSLERIAKPDSKSPVRESLSSLVGYSKFKNGETSEISGITVLDDATVRIDLDLPQAELPRLLGNPSFGIQHLVEGKDPTTTGPFVVDARDDNSLLLKPSASSKTYVDAISVRFYPDVNASYSAMDSEQLDWTPISADHAIEAGAKYGDDLFINSLRTLYLSFNLQDAKFSDQRFREAIVHAINRDAIAKIVSPASLNAFNGVVGEGIPGAQGGGCGSTCNYDLERAKSLLKDQFGDAKPPEITIDIANGSPFNEQSSNLLVSDLAAVGITAHVRGTPATDFGPVTVQADRQLFQTSWSAVYPSPDAFLTPLFFGSSPSNVSGFKSAKVDEEIGKAEAQKNAGERNNSWQTVEREVMGMVPVVPIAQFPIDSVKSERARGISILPTGNFDATSVWLKNPS